MEICKSYGESVERRFLHLVGRFIADGHDGDAMSGGEKLFGEVKPDHSVAAAVGVDYKYILLLTDGAGLNGKALRR